MHRDLPRIGALCYMRQQSGAPLCCKLIAYSVADVVLKKPCGGMQRLTHEAFWNAVVMTDSRPTVPVIQAEAKPAEER